MIINALCPTWPFSIHSFIDSELNVCSDPQTVLEFRVDKGELDPVNVLRIFCLVFLFGKEIIDEIKREELSNHYRCLL